MEAENLGGDQYLLGEVDSNARKRQTSNVRLLRCPFVSGPSGPGQTIAG